jgi:hypothetical protein
VSVLVSVLDPSAPKPLLLAQLELEARVGIEPTHKAFAEPCLTTWLPRRRCAANIVEFVAGASSLHWKTPGGAGGRVQKSLRSRG